MSIHTDKARRKAREMGAWAGVSEASDLWNLSKRELVEVAIRLGASCGGSCDDELVGIDTVNNEIRALRQNGII